MGPWEPPGHGNLSMSPVSFFQFAFLVIFIGVLLLYSAVLVSAIKQSESVSCVCIYIYIYIYIYIMHIS